jgi:hypothetical protein
MMQNTSIINRSMAKKPANPMPMASATGNGAAGDGLGLGEGTVALGDVWSRRWDRRRL